MRNETKPVDGDILTPFERFENVARGLFNVPKHELDEEIAKEQAENKAEKPARKPKSNDRKEAA